MQSGQQTREMFQRAQQCMPFGVTSNYRYWGDNKPLVLKEDKGALEKVNAHGEKLNAGIGKILQERGIPGFVQGPAAMLILQLAPLKKSLKK